MTTTTVYAGVDDAERTCYGTYTQARNATGTFETYADTNTTESVGQNFSTPTYYCIQTFLEFDTSAIADTDVVSTAVLSVTGSNDNDAGDVNAVNVKSYDWGGTAVVDADFRTSAQLAAATQVASFTAASYSGSYFAATSASPAMENAINLTGFTRFVLAAARQESATAPTTEEYWQINSADTSGTTSDPKLVVTHAAPAGQPTSKRWGGVAFAAAGTKGRW